MHSARKHVFTAGLLLAIVLLAYSRGRHAGFVWDDNFQIVRNPYVHGDAPLTGIFSTDVWGYMRAAQGTLSNYYRPLQIVAYRWTAELAGLRPVPFHYLSWLLNWLACFAAYGIFWQITKRYYLAVAAALLFALHPIHSEAVLWIAAAAELGCALFYFVAFWLFLRAQDAVPSEPKIKPKELNRLRVQRRWTTAWSCVSFFVALLWKEMALTLPLVVMAYMWLVAGRETNWRSRLRTGFIRSLPFWATVAVYIALRVAVLGYFSTTQTSWALTPIEYAANVIELIGEYCLRLALPLKLNAYHVFHPVVSIGDLRLIGALIFLAIAAWLARVAARKMPMLAFGAAWVLLTLIPVLYLRAIGLNAFGERYLYIPSLGFILLVVWAGAELLRRMPAASRRYAGVAAVSLIAALSFAQVWNRVPDWRDERTLYTKTLERSPDAAQIRSALAQDLAEAGDIHGAEQQYRAALDAALAQHANAQIANAYLGLAFVASKTGLYSPALDLVNTGLRYERLQTLQLQKGLLLLQLGQTNEAQRTLQEIVRYFPYDSVALNGLGVIASSNNDTQTAIGYFQRAVKSNPLFVEAYDNLGRSYLAAGQTNDAISAFQRATEAQPDNPLLWNDYGVALSHARRYDEAREKFQRASELRQSNAGAALPTNR